jgi:hypothetical protein
MSTCRLTSRLRIVAIIVAVFALYIVLAGSVSKEITAEDIRIIQSLELDGTCKSIDTFDRQIGCIRELKRVIAAKIPVFQCSTPGAGIEPANVMRRRYACCYGRSRFLEKTLKYYHMKARHLALYDISAYGLLSLLVPGIPSHATVEVLTSRGWMGVDSSLPFLLMTKKREPVIYEQLKSLPAEELLEQPEPQDFYAKRPIVIYGLYSRHGMFYGPNLPAPEINYLDFIRYNLFPHLYEKAKL